MKNLLRNLKEICARFPLREKVIIMPSHSAGQELLQSTAREGIPCLNLKTDTLYNIAQRIIKDYIYQHNLSLLPDTLRGHIFQSILQKLKTSDSLKYFNELEITPGISRVIGNAVLEFKMSDFTAQTLLEDRFINTEKGTDLKNVFTEYEKVLQSWNFYDAADVYNQAIKLGTQVDDKLIYIISSNLKLTSLEKRFLHNLTNGSAHFIYHTSVKGLNRPNAFTSNSIPDTEKTISADIQRLAWLYDLENAPLSLGDKTIDIFQAYGVGNEVKEIIRRVRKEKISIDQTAVFYASQEPYVQLFYNVSQKHNLPITFGEGIDIKNSKPGRLFFALLEWIGSNYDVVKLGSIINGGDFKVIGDGLPHSFKIASVLRSIGVGWGRERYVGQLEKEIILVKGKILATEYDDKKTRYEMYLDNLTGTKAFINNIFALLPLEDEAGLYSYEEFTKGIIALIENYSYVAGETDGEAKKTIIESLRVIAEYAQDSLPLEDILLRWESIVSGLRVKRSTPKPGYLHIDSYRKGVWIFRPSNFIVGLDSGRFPGQYREDPIILDIERKALSTELYLREGKIKENTYDMVQLLASIKGRVTLSYSAFDTVENRDVFPASLLLQVYRLLTDDITKDYSQLISYLGSKAGFIPCEVADVTDQTEYWLNQNFINGGIKEPETLLASCYENLSVGLKAWAERESSIFTSYDGKVKVESAMIDPRKNNQLVMSASQLESLAKCPYGYFLKYILKISPPEETKYDPGAWLDGAARGTLLHKIFETFYQDIKLKKENPALVQHESLLYEIADELLVETKGEIPPPSEVIYDYECREIKESCRFFLASEEQESVGATPRHFELAFGFEKAQDPILGEIKPVYITLPSGDRIYLKGRIDRVDQTEDNGFIILDYKTGSTYGFEESKYYQCGKQLQHTLYAAALEKILADCGVADNPKVIAGGYLFPTRKGEGQRFMRSQDDRQPFYEIIETLC
ncbi:MAG: hypothetical protein VR72_08370 [Clostridiaceae bacterium BRH_c20a]|nr:MAG: hypothetical protein VR72_08370 [Clostridiaceae bacterium BRH_c20a]